MLPDVSRSWLVRAVTGFVQDAPLKQRLIIDYDVDTLG